jgi:hypothetical protein
MPGFDYEDAPCPVRPEIRTAHQGFWDRLAGPGGAWTGAQRIAFAREARAAWALRSEPPWLRDLPEPADDVAPARAVSIVRTIAFDVHRIDRDFARAAIAALGDAAYVELLAVTVQTIAIDAFALALGVEPRPLPEARGGSPTGGRPEGLGDIGAYVDCALDFAGPNVGRAMSLAPEDNATFLGLVGSMYAVSDFMEMVWKDRPLSRPQVELVAARVSAVNECFY